MHSGYFSVIDFRLQLPTFDIEIVQEKHLSKFEATQTSNVRCHHFDQKWATSGNIRNFTI